MIHFKLEETIKDFLKKSEVYDIISKIIHTPQMNIFPFPSSVKLDCDLYRRFSISVESIGAEILSTEEETLENAFKELGDISGLTIFDAGPEGIASKYIAERIGDGRVVGVNIWLGAYERTRKKVGDELMGKIVFIKDDIRKIDYLKDNFFDLIVSYETLESVEGMTPGATLPILHQLYRILKHGKWFLAIEHPSLLEVVPINKAQELNLKYLKILYYLWGNEWGKGTYRPTQFSEILKSIGFEEIYWKTVSQAQRITDDDVIEMFQGIRNLANKRINEGKAKESVLKGGFLISFFFTS